MIEELLPAEVASVARRIDGEPGELFPEEVVHLDKAIASRRREFAAGRACAREALAKLGLPPVPILRGEKREPLWPQGIVGSLQGIKRRSAVAKPLVTPNRQSATRRPSSAAQ